MVVGGEGGVRGNQPKGTDRPSWLALDVVDGRRATRSRVCERWLEEDHDRFYPNRRNLLAASGAALLLSGCDVFGHEERVRYKMTVVVDTPNGERSGSAVREIVYRVPAKLPSLVQTRPSWKMRGEAVAVELAPGRTLFALMVSGQANRVDQDYAVWLLSRIYGKDSPRPPAALEGKVIEIWPTPPASLANETRYPFPMLVQFSDILDPASIKMINPSNLSATYGEGFALQRITVSVVDDQLTNTIVTRLPWLKTKKTGMLSGDGAESVQSPNLADHISPIYFTTGLDV